MKTLSAIVDQDHDRDGCIGPVRVLSSAQAGEILARIDPVRNEDVANIEHPWFYKSYLLFTWMNDLVRRPAILDAVEPVVGPDIMVASADIRRKKAGETRQISFHQDAGYWSLEPLEITTAWVALTRTSEANGCMAFAQGTHKLSLVDHDNTYAPDNMLSHSQTAKIDLDRWEKIASVLEPGEMSLHHALLAHGSGPNTTDEPRVGICIRYLPGCICCTGGPPVSVMVVCGRHAATRYINF